MRDLAAVRADISAVIASDLGFGHIGELTAEQRIRLEAETTDAIEQWAEAEHDDAASTTNPGTPLQRLFAEYRELEEQELDRRDRDAGLT